MSPRTAKDQALAVIRDGEAPVRASKLPSFVRFPLLVLLNLSLSTLLYSLAAPYIGLELARVSRRLDGRWEDAAVLAGWRGIELALGWWGGYDGYDLAALTLLSQSPTQYLVTTFYSIRPSTALISLVIDAVSTYAPFRLLRPLSRAHVASASSKVAVPNRDIVTDFWIQIWTTVLAAAIYSVTLYSAYVTYLPKYLALYFEGIPSIAAVYTATPISLLPFALILGLAARVFVFTPAAASTPSTLDAKRRAFNPAKASLAETFWWNLWGYDARTKAVIKRTAALVVVSAVNTFVQSLWTVEGIAWMGAGAWAGVWGTAALVTGGAFGLVGAV